MFTGCAGGFFFANVAALNSRDTHRRKRIRRIRQRMAET
jgi:hypothetical protein